MHIKVSKEFQRIKLKILECKYQNSIIINISSSVEMHIFIAFEIPHDYPGINANFVCT